MTVCVAMIVKDIYSQLPEIVFTADRQVTNDDVCFESGYSKIKLLHVHAYILASSEDAPKSDEIIIKTKQRLSEEKCTVREVVDILSEECKLKYESELEEQRKHVFAKYHTTVEEFKSNSKSKILSDEVKIDILNHLEMIERTYMDYFKADFLVVGIDDAPHIYVVDQFGKIKVLDYQGFAATGSGDRLAYHEITRWANFPQTEAQAIVTVYNAKKRSERAPGVGGLTDLMILRKDPNGVYVHEIATGKLKEILDREIENLWEYEREYFDRIARQDVQNPARGEIFSTHAAKFKEDSDTN